VDVASVDTQTRGNIQLEWQDSRAETLISPHAHRLKKRSLPITRYADLTGVDIVFGKENSAQPPTNASIAYVKLERLTNEQIKKIKEDRQRTDTRRIIAINDGEGLFGGSCPRHEK